MRVIVLLVASLFAVAAYADQLPSRSACIVGFTMDWSGVKADPHAVRNAFTATPNWTRPIKSLTGMTIPDASHIYFQFSRDCDKKEMLARGLIAIWRNMGIDVPRFDRIPDPVIPSTDTIDIRGDAWSDGQLPPGF